MTEPLVSARRVSASFPAPHGRSLRAVDAVSLDIAPGEVVGLVGESGSGKSTLGRLLIRLLPPSSGQVVVAGQDLATLAPRAMRQFRRHMQMVFQDPFASLNPRMTIGNALADPLRLHRGLRGSAVEDAAAELLARVGLPPAHLRRYPRAFSGGQRQRVAIARALASEPRFIVADEPVSALDVSIQAEVVNLLGDLREQLGLSLLFISHDLAVVERIADRVAVLYLGRLIEIGPADAVYDHPAHPYTAALIAAAPGGKGGAPLHGEAPSPLDPPSGCTFRTRCPFAIDACAASPPPLRHIGLGHSAACIRERLPL